MRRTSSPRELQRCEEWVRRLDWYHRTGYMVRLLSCGVHYGCNLSKIAINFDERMKAEGSHCRIHCRIVEVLSRGDYHVAWCWEA